MQIYTVVEMVEGNPKFNSDYDENGVLGEKLGIFWKDIEFAKRVLKLARETNPGKDLDIIEFTRTG